MDKNIRRILAMLLLAVLLLGCRKDNPTSSTPENQSGQNGQGGEGGDSKPIAGEYLLPVIETTDVHGYIVNSSGSEVHYRMAFIADKVKDIRGRDENYKKERLLLLDGGDLYQGASVSNLLEGWPIYVTMDKMGYDAVALGNHEFDWGISTTVDDDATMPDYELGGESFVNEIPVVCANIYKNGVRAPFTKDYVIVEKSAQNSSGEAIPVRIGIIGFAVDYASSIMTSKFTGEGFSIKEDYSIAEEIAANLEASGQCDATVLLIHGGADAAAKSLRADSAIDLVLGGHTHSTRSGGTSSGLVYMQGGRYAEHYASLDLKFSIDPSSGEAIFVSADNQRIFEVDEDRDRHGYEGHNADDLDDEVLAVAKEAISATEGQLNEVIGYITVGATTYSISGSAGRSCTMANWMCDIIRRIGKADVSFVNAA